MILKENYSVMEFDVIDPEGNVTEVKRKYDEINNKLDWFIMYNGDAMWVHCDKKDKYGTLQGYSKFKSEFYSAGSLEMLYRNIKIDKILE